MQQNPHFDAVFPSRGQKSNILSGFFEENSDFWRQNKRGNSLIFYTCSRRCTTLLLCNRGGYISFSDPFQISNPSQLFCNSSTLLKSFSKRKTFSKPSHYIQGGPSQSEYLLRSISNGVYVLLLKAILDFNTEKPSQIHLKSLSSDNLLKTISTHDLL